MNNRTITGELKRLGVPILILIISILSLLFIRNGLTIMLMRSFVKLSAGLIFSHLSWLGLFGSYINMGKLYDNAQGDTTDFAHAEALLFVGTLIGRVLFYIGIMIALALSL